MLIQDLRMEIANFDQSMEDQDSPDNNNMSTVCGINQNNSNTTDSPSLQSKDLNYENCDENLPSPIQLVYRMQAAHCITAESVATMLKCINVCEYCGKKFTAQKALANHVKLHTGEKNHSCTRCGAKFVQLNSLLVHWTKHIGKVADDLDDLVCKICGRKWKSKANLRQHEAIHSGIMFSCNMCESAFNRKDRLTDHIKKKHEGLYSKFSCNICESTFSRKDKLTAHKKRKHEAVHPGAKFLCNVCESTFSRKDKLTAHMKKKHGKNAHDDSMLYETAKYENDHNLKDSEVEVPLGNDAATDSSDIFPNLSMSETT